MLTRDDYVEKKKSQLDGWNAEMKALESKMQKSKETAKKNIQAQMGVIREKQKMAEKQLGSIKSVTKDSWEQFKVDTDNLWTGLKDSMTKFKAHFN